MMNNSVFGKTMENVTTEEKRNYLVSNRIIIKQSFIKKSISNRNEKKIKWL